MGVGGLLGGLAQTNAIVQGGGLQGQIQGAQIQHQRQIELATLMRESALAQAQIERDKSMGDYYAGRNPTQLGVAQVRSDAQTQASGDRLSGTMYGADQRLAGVQDRDQSGTANNAATNLTRLQVAMMNTASKDRATQVRKNLQTQGHAGAGAAIKAIDQRGQGLLAMYPDEQSLTDAMAKDPQLRAMVSQTDPQTGGLSLLDTYHIAMQNQARATQGNLTKMYGAVPSPSKVTQDAQALGITPAPRQLAPSVTPLARTGAQTPQGPPPATLGNTGGLGLAPIDSPNWRSSQGYSMDQLRNMGGGALPPAGPQAPPSPAALTSPGSPQGAGVSRAPRTVQQMQRTLTTNPDITEQQYRAIYNVRPDQAQGTPNGIGSPSQ